MEMGVIGSRMGMKAMKRRMARAADAAARGSKAGKRAQEIYANQVAFTGKGKAKAAKSNIRPRPAEYAGPTAEAQETTEATQAMTTTTTSPRLKPQQGVTPAA
jgi:hypothetical protein